MAYTQLQSSWLLDRKEKIAKVRRICIKANSDLWLDHGDLLKRRIALGIAVPTTLGVADILLALQAARKLDIAGISGDVDAENLDRELILQIVSHWNMKHDDIEQQDDRCVGVLADLLL